MNPILKNNVKIFGKGNTPVIFIHGYGCSQHMWRKVTPAFEEKFKIVLIDLVGSGLSDVSEYNKTKYGTLHGYADDIISLCETLELKDVVLVAHSVSCSISALAANKRPELFSKIVFVCPSPCYIDQDDYRGGFDLQTIQGLIQSLENDHINWSKSLGPVIMGNLDRPEFAAELVESFCVTVPTVAKHFGAVTFLSDNREDYKKLKVPSLILQCKDDKIAPEYVGEYLHKVTPNSTLIQLKAEGHCPHISAPLEILPIIMNFL